MKIPLEREAFDLAQKAIDAWQGAGGNLREVARTLHEFLIDQDGLKIYQEDIDSASLAVFDAMAERYNLNEKEDYDLIHETLDIAFDRFNQGYRNYN